MFIEDRCHLCGECLVRCPELTLSREQAKAEMARLIKDEEPQRVPTECSSCLSCNTYCPQACSPYDLILSRWYGRYHRLGSPPAWRFVFPTQESDLWFSMHALLPEQSRRTVEAWMKAKPSETVFLPGSDFHLVPEVLNGSRLLGDQTVMRLPGHWEDRGWDVLAAMTFHMARAAAADFLRIEEVKADMDPAEWKPRRQLALRTFRSALNHRAGRQAFQSAFRAMQRLVS